jgi:predicted component of type VI protein secretion system
MTTHTYRLLMRSGPNPGKIFDLLRTEVRIGRGTNNDIVIPEMEISREHARLYAQSGSYVIEDLGSTNGTYIDGQRLLGPHLLRSGETIGLGENISLAFETVADPDATIVPPPTIPSARATPPKDAAADKPAAEQAESLQTLPKYTPPKTEEAIPYAAPPEQPAQAEPVARTIPQEPSPAQPAEKPAEYEEEPSLIDLRMVGAGFGCLAIVACILLVAAAFWLDAGGEARWCEYLGFLFPACP